MANSDISTHSPSLATTLSQPLPRPSTHAPECLSTALLTSHLSVGWQGGKRSLLQSLSIVDKSHCDCCSPSSRGCFSSSPFYPALLPPPLSAAERVWQHGKVERQHRRPGCAYLCRPTLRVGQKFIAPDGEAPVGIGPTLAGSPPNKLALWIALLGIYLSPFIV